ncbi:hypothetical protein BT96DRAFT_995915 [Gymnopus androsaceus JB14]|uniref:Uncharacterized protein n=1 Tax=Gymnopus androsaceus JB14 TaxID=1447944 RepID=A0A6A4HJL9_9AGAR|nr:hypothetical protein BT96DRAFT_995915 [Gymnopus androsaceus JB14]
MTLLQQFVSLWKSKDMPDNIPSGISRFNELDESLKSIEIILDDTLQMTILLASLPMSYENVFTTIKSHIESQLNVLPVSTITSVYPPILSPGPDFNYVTHCLLHEEHKCILDHQQKVASGFIATSHLSAAAALAIRPHCPLSEVRCFGYGKLGHYWNKYPDNTAPLTAAGAITSPMETYGLSADTDNSKLLPW